MNEQMLGKTLEPTLSLLPHCARSLCRLYKSCCSWDMENPRSVQPRSPTLSSR